METEGNLGLDFTARDLSGPAFSTLNANLERVSQRMGTLNESFEKGKEKVSVFGSVLAALQVDKAINTLVDFNKRVLDQTAGFKTMGDRLHLATDEYQALRLAMMGAGVSQDAIQSSVVKFNATVAAAYQGNREAIETFKQLGVNILDAGGKLRPTTDLLAESAGKVLKLDESAVKTKLSLDLFGRSGAQLNPALNELSQGVDALVAKFTAAGLIVGKDTVEHLRRLNDQAEMSKAKIDALWAVFATPIYVKGLSETSKQFEELANSFALLNTHVGVLAKIHEYSNFLSGGIGPRLTGDHAEKRALDSLTVLADKYAKARDALAMKRDAQVFSDAELKGETEAVEKLRLEYKGAYDAYEEWRKKMRGGDKPTDPPAQTRTTGAGMPAVRDQAGADSIEKAIARLQGERAAAERALGTLISNGTKPLDELNKAVALQKAIDDQIAKLGSKSVGDARLPQLKAEVEARQQAEDRLKRYSEALQLADETERKFGNGKLELETTTRKLNEALATGRLSYEAYTAAIRDADFAAKQQALTVEGQKGGLEGLAAGFQSAANAYARQNTAYNMGAQAFQDTASLMSNSMTQWRKTGQLDMQQFLASWVDMLAQMAMRWSAMQAFSAISGVFSGGGSGGGIGGWLGGLFNGGGGSLPQLPTWGNYFADGGRPPTGEASVVGEEGPELFVPDTAGTVVPADRTRDMVEGAGGQIVIHQQINVSTGVQQTVRAEIVELMPMIKRASVEAVQQARTRGGAFARDFRS